MPSAVDEKVIRSDDFAELTRMLSRAKRDVLLPKINEPAYLITGDTVLFCGNELFERPSDAEEERKFFRAYDGKTEVGYHSSVTVTNTETGEKREGTETGAFSLGPFPDDFVEQYISEGEYTQYAGGFTFMDSRIAEKYKAISGNHDTLMGMPVELTKKFLIELGWK
jgi:predicted house-cleaning NTP pyrophosphatase (Maf/HAM1 superfamily)